jgi:hypothetical protein
MMKNWMVSALCGVTLLAASGAMAQAVVGKPAPAFRATDASGKTVALSDYTGKFVVLEWTNPNCPFVGKHYNSGSMPASQRRAVAEGVAWLSIQTIPDDRDHKALARLQAWQKSKKASPTATIVDADGRIARAYLAKATPHMYIVDPKGTLIYAGAIDSKPSTDPADIKTATNYVSQALDEALSGKPVSHPVSQAYGCAVEYPSGV